jgi:hypothetical protein
VPVLVPVVTVGLVIACAPATGDLAGVDAAADRLVPAEAVIDDGAEDPPHVRVQAVAAAQPKGVLALQVSGAL